MRLYIANVTPQYQTIHYRLDYLPDGTKDGRLLIPYKSTPPIPPGRQTQVGGDWEKPALDSIINQLEPFGLVGEVDISRLPKARRVTYVFNLGKVVSEKAIREAHAHNTGVLVDDGALRRKRAAVGAADIVAKSVAEQTAQIGLDVPLTGFEMSVEQEEQSELGERRVEEGYTVDVAGKAEPPPGGRGRGGRRSGRAA